MDDIVFPACTVIRNDSGSPVFGYGTPPTPPPFAMTGVPFWDSGNNAFITWNGSAWVIPVPTAQDSSGNRIMTMGVHTEMLDLSGGETSFVVTLPINDGLIFFMRAEVVDSILGAGSEVPDTVVATSGLAAALDLSNGAANPSPEVYVFATPELVEGGPEISVEFAIADSGAAPIIPVAGAVNMSFYYISAA